jgi:large subunit ribosomal protein L32
MWKATAPTLSPCPNRACGELKPPHVACANCGQYAGRQVLSV